MQPNPHSNPKAMHESLRGKKILFSTLPADGHFNPLTALARYLQAAGCDVRWYTSLLFKGKLDKLGIPHYPFRRAMDTHAQHLDEHFPARKSMTDALKS
jgi:UDP:flavonoid glycosyltransferase YjiC (YdhE family)